MYCAYIFSSHFVSVRYDLGSLGFWSRSIVCDAPSGLWIYTYMLWTVYNHWLFLWLCGRLQCLQCISNGDTAVLHWAIDLVLLFKISLCTVHTYSSHIASVYRMTWARWDSDHGLLFVMLQVYCGYIHICCGLFIYHWLFRWLCVRLQYLQCVSNGDTAVLYWAVYLVLLFEKCLWTAHTYSAHIASVYCMTWARWDSDHGLMFVMILVYCGYIHLCSGQFIYH